MARPAKTSVATLDNVGSTALSTISFEQELESLRSRLAAPSGDKVKFDNKTFKLPDGSTASEIDVVIVDFVYFNSYYESAYDSKNIVPPACFAIHPEPKQMAPSANSPEAQHETCSGCWANEFGSAKVGAGKACGNRVHIAVLPRDAKSETPFWILDISPTAIKGFSSYINSVLNVFKRPPYGVVTKVSFDQNSKYDVAVFSDPILLDGDDPEDVALFNIIRERRDEARQRLLTEPDVSAFKSANDAPAPAGRRTALKAPAKRRA